LDLIAELKKGLPTEGPKRLAYTQRAFGFLPALEKPRILDVGCGNGVSTLELARLTQGNIVGLDTNKSSLNELDIKAREAGLSQRIKTVNRSMSDMDFPDESFDVIWAEGSIFFVGFEKGLNEWQRFLKPDGFIVVHEMAWLRPHPPDEISDYWRKMYPGICTVQECLHIISRCGYDLIGHFALPEDAWWELYYGPLEERVLELGDIYQDDPGKTATLDSELQEIELYKKYNKWYGSAFFIMRKTGQ